MGGGCRALLTCYHEGCHNSNCQGCSVVNEDLGEEVNKGQKEGEECDVIEAVGEQKEAGYHIAHSMGTWLSGKETNLHAAPSVLTVTAQRALGPLPSEVQKLPGQQLREQGSVFNGALKVTGIIWPEGR